MKLPKIEVRNVVVSVKFADKLDLKSLKALPRAEYKPKNFPGVVYYMDKPKASFLIFGSGKMNCVGANSLENAKKAIKLMVSKLKEVGVKTYEKPEITVQNMVASADLGRELNLNTIAYSTPTTEYGPEQFPGLVYRMEDPKIVFLLFAKGKVVITGAKSLEKARKGLKKLVEMLKRIGQY